jgi:hypothetical protein
VSQALLYAGGALSALWGAADLFMPGVVLVSAR